MEFFNIRTGLVEVGSGLTSVIFKAVREAGIEFFEGDILIITSKLVATCENRIVPVLNIKPSEKSKLLAEKASLSPEFAEVVIREAEDVYGCVEGAILTLREGIIQANAGVDRSNAPPGTFILLPENPDKTAYSIHKTIKEEEGVHVGVIICDSNSLPLRIGTGGFALAVAGFEPVVDERGKNDLFGRPLQVTRRNLADSLAHAAQILMGESDEGIPMVLARGAPVRLVNDFISSDVLKIAPEECMFLGVLCSRKDFYEIK